jgi:two-component system, OmpR family, alkaline phosphatase synthesis response regulator PhoP
VKRVLVVEDSELAMGLRVNLEQEGYEVEVARDGRCGLELARSWAPDLIVLDLMLPELDGLHVLRALRQEGRATPVLVLTARGQESDKVLGLKLGGDDYVTKPFGLLELLARVEALLRRSDPPPSDGDALHRFGDVELREGSRTVRRAGELVELTPKEYELLLVLLRARGDVVSRHELLRRVWGYRADVATRTLDTHVGELRRKLEPEVSTPRHILTVRKVGYRLAH